MRVYTSLPVLAALLTFTACDQIRTPGSERAAQTEETTVVELVEVETDQDVEVARTTIKRAVIDWEKARADYATRDTGPDDNLFEVASADDLPVPILLPSTPVTAASTDDNSMSFRPLEDGYYAVYRGEVYDMIINGTDRLVAAPGRVSSQTDTDLRFEETMTGAQIAFSRYGASYLVEFACKSAAAAMGDGCVSEEEARTAVQDLLLAGTQ